MDANWLDFLPITLSLFLTGGVGIYAWRHRQSPGIQTFAFVTFAEFSWTLGYLFELASPTVAGKVFWDDFQFIGSLFTPLLLMFFAFEFTGFEKSFSRRARFVLAAIPTLFLILLYTNPLHGWVRDSSAHIVPGEPFDALLYDFTTPMWVSFIFAYIADFAATVLFIRNLFRQHRLFRTQTLIIIIGFVFPFIGSFPGLFGTMIFGQRDITPYTFGIANLIYAWGLFRFKLFEITPIARYVLMDNMSDAVIVLDAQLRVVDINPSAIARLDLSANQIIGMPISKLLVGQADLIAMFQHDEAIREDIIYYLPKGESVILDTFISPLHDQNNNLIGRMLVARDITKQKQMEAGLRRAHDQLEMRVQLRTTELANANRELEEKNAELERFTYTVSHDLKSPLVTISGYLGFLQADIERNNLERLKNDTQRIASAVDKMYQLLNDLLELSRIGRKVNPFEIIPFEDLTREALDNVHGRLTARGITVQTQPGLPAVYGDKPRLIEVLQNLLDNAAKFMGDQPAPTIEIGFQGEGNDRPIYFVRDNGIGIAPQYHEQIFGLFNRLDPRVEGTGVGLALVKRIVEFHGGRIWVESEPGKGSTFYFSLQGGDSVQPPFAQ